MVMYYAYNDPKQIRKLEPKRLAAELSVDDLPPMLRIPKKKKQKVDGD